MKRRWYAFRVWLARRMLPDGLAVHRTTALVEAQEALEGLARYTEASGHLTRAFHAGKRVRWDAEWTRRCIAGSSV